LINDRTVQYNSIKKISFRDGEDPTPPKDQNTPST
jgi:hypothetical protein